MTPGGDGGSWADVVASALVGTTRRPAAVPDADGALGDTLAAVRAVAPAEAGDGDNGSAGLLAAATVLAAYREAGRTLPVDPLPAPEPAPPDERPVASPRATAALSAILGDRTYAPLLPEWLDLAAGAGVRLPPEVVPTVFDAVGATHRPAAVALAGPLGGWLAGRNEAWEWAASGGAAVTGTPDQLEAAWAAGSDERRLAALTALRDADPGRARALLASTWATEPAAVRLAALDVVARSLAPEDEPLLEDALDDRRRDVRRRAATLLAALPDSRRGARMAARAVPLVRVEGRLRKRLVVDLPELVDDAMVRDGIDPRAPGGGERRWWLLQLVAGTPLRAWTEALGRPPAELVALALSSDGAALVEGWSAAAAVQGDEDWARALLAASAPAPAAAGPVLSVLPAEEGDGVAAAWVRRHGLAASLGLLVGADGALPRRTTDAVVAALVDLVKAPEPPGAHAVRGALGALALRLDAAVAPSAVARLAVALEEAPAGNAKGGRAFWDHSVGTLGAVLHFRHSLHEEFR